MKRKAKIYYISLPDEMRKEDKLAWLRENPISTIAFERIEPDTKNNWINQTDNDWDSLLPLIDKDVKAGKSEEAVFQLYGLGIASHRDDWVYDFSKINLEKKVCYLIKIYEASRKDKNYFDKNKIQWDRELENYLRRNITKHYEENKILEGLFRPYVKRNFYLDKHLNGMVYQFPNFIRNNEVNYIVGFNVPSSTKTFHCVATNTTIDLNCSGPMQCYSLYYFDSENQKHENITDWGLTQFQNHYKSANGKQITKQDIFYYTYAVLHSPVYRVKYEQNLKREFPRLPFYEDFFQWRDWGKELMDLHINYETREPFALERKDLDVSAKTKNKAPNLFDDCLKDNNLIASGENPTLDVKNNAVPVGDEFPVMNSSPSAKENLVDDDDGLHPSLSNSSVSPTKTGSKSSLLMNTSNNEIFTVKPKTKLRADKTNGTIEIDSLTTLTGIPALAWEYKLGNRSALEWILDQYKEKKPSDATIREHFNTYKFEDYKEQVIDLLKRVCNVSVKTMEIVNQMPNAD